MPTRRRQAFTLIELIVIILIIAAVVGVVVPRYTQFYARTRLSGEVREIRDLLAEAHERAIMKDTTTQVTFDAGSQTFVLEVTSRPPQQDIPIALMSEEQDRQSQTPTANLLRVVQLSSEYTAAVAMNGERPGQATVLRFRSDGTAEGAMIMIKDETGEAQRLTVMPATGRILLETSVE